MAPPIKDVSVADFADILGVTSARVYQFIQEGMPHRKRVKKGTRIVPREAIQWRIEREREQARPEDGRPPRPRDRLEIAQAELKELEVLEVRKSLIPIEEFETFVDSFVGGFAAVASGRLQRFERDIVEASSPATARKLTEQIHGALMAGAQEYGEHLDDEAAALEADDAGEAAA